MSLVAAGNLGLSPTGEERLATTEHRSWPGNQFALGWQDLVSPAPWLWYIYPLLSVLLAPA